MLPRSSEELVCCECGATSEHGVGWKAELAPDLLEGVDEDEVAVYCSRCHAAEFSDWPGTKFRYRIAAKGLLSEPA